MLNQEIMWHDAFWLKLPVYIAAEVLDKYCVEQKNRFATLGRLIDIDRKLICNFF